MQSRFLLPHGNLKQRNVGENDNMSTVLREAPRHNTQALSKIFNHLNKLEKLEVDVIGLLPVLSDDEVMETRNYAKLLGKSAWKIEIACDAEIWNRTKAACGRGNVDIDEDGIMAAVNKRAGELGCSARTVYSNGRVFNTFKEEIVATDFNHLDEKTFYLAALTAAEPHAAIEHFAAEKLKNPFFSTRDAFREARKSKKALYEAKNRIAYEVNHEKRQALRRHFDSTKLALEGMRDACAKIDTSLASNMYGSWIQEIEDQEDVWFVEDAKVALIKAWRNGNTRESHMATALGLPITEVHRIAKELEGEHIFEKSRQGGKTDVARGPGQQLWHLVGEPIPTYKEGS